MQTMRTPQNKSHAVMAQRHEHKKSLDNFPTPPWATRALLKQILQKHNLDEQTCLEPACGAGHMSKVLKESFKKVLSSDVYPYGYGDVSDFLTNDPSSEGIDWMITNPPFRYAEEFILRGLDITKFGVAVLTRTVFLESIGRYQRLFSPFPPSVVAQFCERVPMVKGRLDAKATTATGYSWIIWDKSMSANTTQLTWIKPCRKILEKPNDYLEEHSSEVENQ